MLCGCICPYFRTAGDETWALDLLFSLTRRTRNPPPPPTHIAINNSTRLQQPRRRPSTSSPATSHSALPTPFRFSVFNDQQATKQKHQIDPKPTPPPLQPHYPPPNIHHSRHLPSPVPSESYPQQHTATPSPTRRCGISPLPLSLPPSTRHTEQTESALCVKSMGVVPPSHLAIAKQIYIPYPTLPYLTLAYSAIRILLRELVRVSTEGGCVR